MLDLLPFQQKSSSGTFDTIGEKNITLLILVLESQPLSSELPINFWNICNMLMW